MMNKPKKELKVCHLDPKKAAIELRLKLVEANKRVKKLEEAQKVTPELLRREITI